MLSIESMMNELVIRIEIVKNYICITWMTCSEDNNLKIFGQGSKQVDNMRTNIDSSLNFLSCWKFDLYLNITRRVNCIVAMYKGFIQVKDYWFSIWVNEELPAVLGLRGSLTSRFSAYSWEGTLLDSNTLMYWADMVICSLASERSSLWNFSISET